MILPEFKMRNEALEARGNSGSRGFRIPRSALRTPHSAFTMVEIALSLAIIAFALIAIIGVLPAGLSVQKDNREQTIINLDAAYLMDAIRHGPLGQDNLTNYVVSITQNSYKYQGHLVDGLSGLSVPDITSCTFTTNQTIVSNALNGVNTGGSMLTSGFNIVGLLSMPKYVYLVPAAPGAPLLVVWSNTVTAVFRAINAPAVDQGQSQASRDFAFQYQVTIEIARSAGSPYLANGGWVNLTAPNIINAVNPSPGTSDLFYQDLQKNQFEMRLTFRWPVLPNGQLGTGRQVFRSSVTGTYLTNSPPLPPLPVNNPQPYNSYLNMPMGASYAYPNEALLFFMQPETYTTQP